MIITYNRNGGDMGVNVTVGNGMGCKLRVQLFDETGAPTPPPAGIIYENWLDDGLEPEYIIPKATGTGNKKLFILHTYSAAPIIVSAFQAISDFTQDDVTQADLTTHSQTGGDIYHKIYLVGQ